MNVKTYTWIKYLATLGSILLLIDPLLIILKVTNDNFFIQSWTALIASTIPIYCLGVIFLGIYLWLRLFLIKKSYYEYTKKDQFYLFLSFSLYLLAVLMSGIFLLVGLFHQTQKTLTFILFGISYFMIVVGMIGGAITETLSRVQEQIQLYQEQEVKINQLKKQKRDMLLKNEISEEEISEEVKANRTNEAQELIARAQVKKIKKQAAKKTKQKLESTPIIEIEKEYNPFLDEKMNQELQTDPKFKKWLENEKE